MFDTALNELKAGKGPHQICGDLHYCSLQEGKELSLVAMMNQSSVVQNDRTDKPCVYCQMFTTLIEVAMDQNKTQVDEIREYADMICGMLGDQNLCHQYVNKLDFVVDALKKGESTSTICNQLKFCISPKPMPIMRGDGMIVSVNKPEVDIDNCFFCTKVAALFKAALEKNPQQIVEIQELADMICNELPKTNKVLNPTWTWCQND